MAQQYTNPWAQALQARGEALKLKKLNAFTSDEGNFWLNHSYRGQFQVNPTGDGLLFKDSRGNKDFKGLPDEAVAFEKYKTLYAKHNKTANWNTFTEQWTAHRAKYGEQLAQSLDGMEKRGFSSKALQQAMRDNESLKTTVGSFMADAKLGPLMTRFLPKKTSAVGQPMAEGIMGAPRIAEIGTAGALQFGLGKYAAGAGKIPEMTMSKIPKLPWELGKANLARSSEGIKKAAGDLLTGKGLKDNPAGKKVKNALIKDLVEKGGGIDVEKDKKIKQKYKKDGSKKIKIKTKSGKNKGKLRSSTVKYKKGDAILDAQGKPKFTTQKTTVKKMGTNKLRAQAAKDPMKLINAYLSKKGNTHKTLLKLMWKHGKKRTMLAGAKAIAGMVGAPLTGAASLGLTAWGAYDIYTMLQDIYGDVKEGQILNPDTPALKPGEVYK